MVLLSEHLSCIAWKGVCLLIQQPRQQPYSIGVSYTRRALEAVFLQAFIARSTVTSRVQDRTIRAKVLQ